MDAMSGKRVLIVVENLPVPLDRRVWQEACALRDAGYVVTIVCPKMRGYTATEEFIDGIQIYRHWISSEASGVRGFLLEYTSALVGELWCAMKAWRRGGFDIIHLCNPPDLLFLVALPFKLLFGTKVVYDVHDLWPEMFVAKFRRRGLLRQGVLYWGVLLAHRCTLAVADCVIATNESVKHMVLKRGQLSDDVVSVVRTSPVAIDTTVEADPDLKGGKPYLVVYVGVMGDADGVRHLIEAADHLVNEMNRDDVTFLINHEGLPLARTRSGTLELFENQRGLRMRASLDMRDPDVRSIVPKMQRGDLDKMSFAFIPTRQKWKDVDGKDLPRRTIEEAELYDVSIVTTPAYSGTEIGLRSLEQFRKSQRKSQAPRRMRMKDRLQK